MDLSTQATQPSEPDYSKTYSDKHGEYRLIALTQGQFTKVEASDFEWLNKWKWYALWSPCALSFYVLRQQSIPQTAGVKYRQKSIRMHRLIMGDPASKIDHKDCDTLNNRRYNLRNATDSQNGANRSVSRNSISGLKGVSPYKNGKWHAQITKDKRVIHLGYFDTTQLAHDAYVRAARSLHGEFYRP